MRGGFGRRVGWDQASSAAGPPLRRPRRTGRSAGVVILALAALLLAGWWLSSRGITTGSGDPLVVYCAHDQVFAEQVLKDFEKKTGIAVSVKYDTEATKSLGLAQLLIQERSQPRCDVFWNNQVLTMAELKRQEVLHAYQGPGWQRIPTQYRDPDGFWVGFGARFRVNIVNTSRMQATKDAVDEAFTRDDLSRISAAVPLYGTTLTHYTVLWREWGPTRLKEWHDDVRKHGLREARGNGAVMQLVAAGTCDAGWTDTDDFFVALDKGDPVAMLPVRVGGATICIPNSAAVIRGTQKLDAARQLVDYLASAETEVALARSQSRQAPLGPVDPSQIPDEVQPLLEWVKEGYDLNQLETAHGACLEWLTGLYAK